MLSLEHPAAWSPGRGTSVRSVVVVAFSPAGRALVAANEALGRISLAAARCCCWGYVYALPCYTGSLQFKRPAYKKRHGGRQTAVHGHERSRGGDTALRDAALDGPEEEGGREKRARAEQDADAGRATAA